MNRPKRMHLQVIIDEEHGRRFFAACSPCLSVREYTGTRLTPHVQLVNCPGCHATIRRVRAARR
jgi:hypothetical protein